MRLSIPKIDICFRSVEIVIFEIIKTSKYIDTKTKIESLHFSGILYLAP